MRFQEKIEVKSNLIITARERGKLVARREGHNIWVNLGREFIAYSLGYSSYLPSGEGVPERTDRIRYMGLGIGGNRQNTPAIANSAPVVGHYPGTNSFTDTDPTRSTLERPVRVSWGNQPPTAPPYDPSVDQWYGQVAPLVGTAGHPTPYSTRFVRVFLSYEVNGIDSFYPVVPVSEIGLFTSNIVPSRPSSSSVPTNTYVAYDTFDAIPKTIGVDLQFDWTLNL